MKTRRLYILLSVVIIDLAETFLNSRLGQSWWMDGWIVWSLHIAMTEVVTLKRRISWRLGKHRAGTVTEQSCLAILSNACQS